MAATEQEMMERAARIQTIEELREVSAELGLELSPEKEAAFMAVRTAEGELTEQQLDATVGGAYHVVSPSDVCDFQASETKCCATCKYGQFDWPNYYCGRECRTGGCNRAESRLRLVGRGLRPFIGGTR